MSIDTQVTWTGFIGIDVSKRTLDVHLLPERKSMTVENSLKGFVQIASKVNDVATTLICLESTGCYQDLLVMYLQDLGYQVAVVNPRQVRDYAKSGNKLAKTDRIDARSIAEFARVHTPRITRSSGKNQAELKQLVARRRQLEQMLTQEKNRLSQAWNPKIKDLIETVIKTLEEQLAEVDRESAELVKGDEILYQKNTILRSVPGIGPVTSITLLAELQELGELNRGQVGKLAGLAPINRDSGQFRGKRMIGGGRPNVRRALYMACLSAIQHNDPLREFYQRLVANGKSKMVAYVATMRKMLVTLNTILKKQEMWNNATGH